MADKKDYDKVRELTAKIDVVKGQLEDAMFDRGRLTELGMKLALLNSDLSVYSAIFHEEATSVEIDTYFEERSGGKTQGDSKEVARKAKLPDRKFYELVKAQKDSNEALMARLRDRQDYLAEENRRTTLKGGNY